MNDILLGDLKLKEIRGYKIDEFKCSINNLLEMERNIIIKTSSAIILDEDVIEVLFLLFSEDLFFLKTELKINYLIIY
jgi:hypothetical protein